MKPLFRKIVRASMVAGLSLSACLSVHAQEEAEGIVRISQPKANPAAAQLVTPTAFHHGQRQAIDSSNCDCQLESGGRLGRHAGGGSAYGMSNGCDQCQGGGYMTIEDMFCATFGRNRNATHADMQQAKCDYLRCKFGYVVPTGAGGAGIPWAGKYSRVYPQDPYYFDQRDGQTFAAQGYGAPIAVPLAPVVGHTYNYGWGIPSSRLTPVSRPAY